MSSILGLRAIILSAIMQVNEDHAGECFCFLKGLSHK